MKSPGALAVPLPSDLDWLAAAIDFEGSLQFGKNKRKDGTAQFAWRPSFQLANTNKDLVDKTKRICGGGSIYFKITKDNRKNYYLFCLSHNGLRYILPFVWYRLISKRKQAELLIEALGLLTERRKMGNLNRDDKKLEEIYCKMKELNRRGK